jgi:hypothetical protein
MVNTTDDVLRRINMRWASLSREQRALVDHLVEQLAANKR